MSALTCGEAVWESKSERPFDLERRYSRMFLNPPIKASSSFKVGSSSDICSMNQCSSILCHTYYFQEAHGLVGLHEASELAISAQCFSGIVREMYAMVAIHTGSMDGRLKAGPHTWSSRTIFATASIDQSHKVTEGLLEFLLERTGMSRGMTLC